MKSPGNFLIIDNELTKLLQIMAKMHPYGNKTILKIILKFYIKLAKRTREKGIDPFSVLEGLNERYLASDYKGYELKKAKRLSEAIEETEGKDVPSKPGGETGELKNLMKELQKSLNNIAARRRKTVEDFVPRESAKLSKAEQKEVSSKDDELGELRSLMKNLQNSMNYIAARQRQGQSTLEDFDPKDAAKYLKIEQGVTPQERQDYRKIRKQKHHRKIDF